MKSYILFLLIIFQWSFAQHDAIYAIGEKLINENKLDEAKIYFENNLKKATNNELKIKLYIGLADIYKAEINNLEASKNYKKALQLSEKIKNSPLEFLCYVKIGEFYRRRHLLPEFEKELEKAAILLKTHTIDDKYLTKYYNRKAALFTELYNNNDSTLFYAKKSLELAKKVKDLDNVFYSTLEIAGVYERRYEYKTSIKYIESILEYAGKNNMVQHHSDAYVSYIMALIRDGQKNKALKIAFQAKAFAKTNNLPIDENHFNEYIYQIYLSVNNFKKAHEYLKYFNDLKYKIDKVQNDKELVELETKYKSKEKDNQLKINQLEIINKDKELSSNKAKLYLLIGLFLIAVLITLLIGYFYTKSNKSNKQLKILSNQNEFLVSETNHRVNNNLQLIAVLIENRIRKNENENEKSEFKRLLTKVEAIATLHRCLYNRSNINTINLQEYLLDIKNNFDELILEENIHLNMVVDIVDVDSDTALFLGLLITELIINSMKHAFEVKQEKRIELSVDVINNQLDFTYKDNGKKSKQKVLKPVLVEQLCMQLEVQHTINTENGFQLNFKKSL